MGKIAKAIAATLAPQVINLVGALGWVEVNATVLEISIASGLAGFFAYLLPNSK